MKLISIRVIALWQILGGVLILGANLLAWTQQSLPDNLLYLITSFGVAILAIVAGYALWRQSLTGVRLSIIAQILQLTWISLPRTQFGVILGPLAGFQLTTTVLGHIYFTFSLGFYGKGGLFLLPADSPERFPISVTINLLAVLALVRLWKSLNSRISNADEKA